MNQTQNFSSCFLTQHRTNGIDSAAVGPISFFCLTIDVTVAIENNKWREQQDVIRGGKVNLLFL